MSKSIIPQPEPRQCYVCGARKRLEVHHVMYGHGPRHLSEKYGLKVTLCDMHHRHAPAGIHAGNRELDLRLKAVAQTEFEKIYGHSKWMRTFGRNYLEEPVEVAPVQQEGKRGQLGKLAKLFRAFRELLELLPPGEKNQTVVLKFTYAMGTYLEIM